MIVLTARRGPTRRRDHLRTIEAEYFARRHIYFASAAVFSRKRESEKERFPAPSRGFDVGRSGHHPERVCVNTH